MGKPTPPTFSMVQQVRITPQMAEAMARYPEINWSEVARQCWAARLERERRKNGSKPDQ